MRLNLTFLILFITTCGWSQNTFMKTIGTDISDYGTACIPTSDYGTMLVTGGGMFGGGVQFGMVKTSYDGTIEWQKVFNHGNFALAYDVVATGDKGYCVFGSVDNAGSNKALFLFRTDSLGNEVWNYSIEASLNDRPVSLIKCKNGGFLTCSIFNYNSTGYPQAQLIRFDEYGTMLWSKLYSLQFGVKPKAVVEMSDGGFAFVAFTKTGSFEHTLLARVDDQGTLQWSKVFETQYDDEPFDLVVNDQDELFVAGASYFINSELDGYFLKVDAGGSLLQSVFYDAGTSNGEVFRRLALAEDGSVLLIGDKGTSGERNITLMKVNPNSGTPIWSYQYPLSPQFTNYPADIYVSFNEGIVFTGDVRPPTYVRDAALFRTDRDGVISCYTEPVTFSIRNISFNTSNSNLSEFGTVPDLPQAISFTLPPTPITEKTVCEDPGPVPFNSWQLNDTCPNVCFSFTDESIGEPTAWLWKFEGATPSISEEQNPQNICFSGDGQFKVSLTVTNADGSSTFEKYITIGEFYCPIESIPNVFSPNDDGVNDFFQIDGLSGEFKLTIHDRWGITVFETTDKNEHWDGKSSSGKPLSEGVYFYMLERGGEIKQGFLHLVR